MQTGLPSLSVVTPSLNQGRFLEACLRSVLTQSLPPLEYFVIDGGSTDESVCILHKYDSLLTGWTSRPDRGQADAVNRGVRQCHGDIVAWINSDDCYLPGAFEAVSCAMREHPEAVLVYGVDLSPGVRQPVKTLLTVGWKILDRQDNCTAYWKPVGEAEAVPAGEQTAEE